MSGDRHLRADRSDWQERICGGPAVLASVLISASIASAQTLAGQHLLQMLVNLLARQFHVVGAVLLDVPDVPLLPGVALVPRIESGTLLSALLTIGDAVGGDVVRTRAPQGSTPSVAICVGTDLDPAGYDVPAIGLWGNGWRMSARTDAAASALGDASSNPLGPYFAACVGAGFAFKSAFGHQPESLQCDLDLWRGAGDGPDPATVTPPAAYVLGLGAVGASFSHALAAAGVRGRLVGVDPQPLSETDRNRVLTGTRHDVGISKTDLFARIFVGTPIDSYPVKGRWPEDYLADPTRAIPEELRSSESALRFEWVISCVDRDRDRIGIARALPRHVLSGSTDGMLAQTAYYSCDGICECLACHRRTPRQLGVEELAQQLRGNPLAERQQWYERFGATPQERASIEEYLSDPTCGGPGGADLARLGLSGEVDWAVGFASVAAGVLLAARFISCVREGVKREIDGGSEVRYFFWKDELEVSRAQRAAGCLVCAGMAASWRELWMPDGRD